MKEPWQDVRAAQINCEAVKVSLMHNKDGYLLRLAIQPDDIPVELLRAKVGTRYQLVMVEVNDDETPKVPARKRKGDRLVVSAGMLCKQQKFWDYMDYAGICSQPMSEQEAIHSLYHYLNIESRSELAHPGEARDMFDGLKGEFESWAR